MTITLTSLDKRVLRQLGGGAEAKSYAEDAANHGADAGFPGFTYYSDTVAFFKRNRSAIMELLEEMAGSMGMGTSSLLAGFRCLKGLEADPMTILAHGARHEEYTQVANALAWFALEETGRKLVDG